MSAGMPQNSDKGRLSGYKRRDMYLAKTSSVAAAADNGSTAQQTSDASTAGAQHSFENPDSCFIMACKHVEIFALPLIDVCNVMSYRCTLEDMRNSVNHILDALGFDIGMVTGIDVAHKLLEICTPHQA